MKQQHKKSDSLSCIESKNSNVNKSFYVAGRCVIRIEQRRQQQAFIFVDLLNSVSVGVFIHSMIINTFEYILIVRTHKCVYIP